MSVALALPLFGASALLTLAAAGFFADKLDHIGPRLGLPEAAVGLLTALAADTPEIASAIVALAEGRKQASLGVVLGSNVFNLAAMIGLSALVAGSVAIRRRALAIEGAASMLAFLVTAGLVLGLLPAAPAFVLLLAIVGPYVVFTLRRAPGHPPAHRRAGGEAILEPVLLIVPAVALIVVGATGMVKAALALADRWHVSQTITGLLVLAILTSLPNAFTAVRLGRAGRGDALVTETLASNTINLTGGVLVPALFVGIVRSSGGVEFDLAWLLGMTLLALLALAPARGLGRPLAALLVCAYLVFVAVQLTIS